MKKDRTQKEQILEVLESGMTALGMKESILQILKEEPPLTEQFSELALKMHARGETGIGVTIGPNLAATITLSYIDSGNLPELKKPS